MKRWRWTSMANSVVAALTLSLAYPGYVSADDFSTVYQNFQNAYAEHDLERSTALAKQAWQLGKAKFGNNSEQAISLHHSYANMLFEAGQHADGLDEYHTVAVAYEKKWGSKSAQYINALSSILDKTATISMQTELPASTIVKYNQNVTRQIVTGIDEVSFASDNARAIVYLIAAKTIIQAAPFNLSSATLDTFFTDAHRYALAVWGEADLNTAQALFYSAMIAEMRHHDEQAIERYQRVLLTFDALTDFTHPMELQAHARLVNIYENEGLSDAATKHCRAIGNMTPWDDTQDPTPLYRLDPKYPVSLAKRGREGSATLSYVINKNGVVTDIQVEDDSHGKAFADESVKALKQWRFAPRFVQGKAVDSPRQTVQLDFLLGS
ncbi:energy transducer TonB [Salinimonas lutimaris]|uniref:energy transducer TonB n=1 Tax=Salinimonas lutimaris TaxID=914153 RepID=UPI0010C04A29|nr:TonB family protein [Salinimonas lutimaris]